MPVQTKIKCVFHCRHVDWWWSAAFITAFVHFGTFHGETTDDERKQWEALRALDDGAAFHRYGHSGNSWWKRKKREKTGIRLPSPVADGCRMAAIVRPCTVHSLIKYFNEYFWICSSVSHVYMAWTTTRQHISLWHFVCGIRRDVSTEFVLMRRRQDAMEWKLCAAKSKSVDDSCHDAAVARYCGV